MAAVAPTVSPSASSQVMTAVAELVCKEHYYRTILQCEELSLRTDISNVMVVERTDLEVSRQRQTASPTAVGVGVPAQSSPLYPTRKWHPLQYRETNKEERRRMGAGAGIGLVSAACSVPELKQGTCRFADEVTLSEYRRVDFENHTGQQIDRLKELSRKIRSSAY